jgi:hypothetical protein
MLCGSIDGHYHLGGTCCLHLQGGSIILGNDDIHLPKKNDIPSWRVTVLSKVAVVVTMKSREYGVFYRKCV